MKITMRRVVTLAVIALLAFSLVALAGCGKKAPALTPEQLMAAIQANQLPEKHPLSMEKAQAQGCRCHTEAAGANK